MEGVEILNKIEIVEHYDALIVLGIICIALCWIFMFLSDESIEHDILFAILSLACIVGAVILLSIGLFKEIPTGKYKYEVTISDEVNFNEFSDKYKILKQRGEIYIVKER